MRKLMFVCFLCGNTFKQGLVTGFAFFSLAIRSCAI